MKICVQCNFMVRIVVAVSWTIVFDTVLLFVLSWLCRGDSCSMQFYDSYSRSCVVDKRVLRVLAVRTVMAVS